MSKSGTPDSIKSTAYLLKHVVETLRDSLIRLPEMTVYLSLELIMYVCLTTRTWFGPNNDNGRPHLSVVLFLYENETRFDLRMPTQRQIKKKTRRRGTTL